MFFVHSTHRFPSFAIRNSDISNLSASYPRKEPGQYRPKNFVLFASQLRVLAAWASTPPFRRVESVYPTFDLVQRDVDADRPHQLRDRARFSQLHERVGGSVQIYRRGILFCDPESREHCRQLGRVLSHKVCPVLMWEIPERRRNALFAGEGIEEGAGLQHVQEEQIPGLEVAEGKRNCRWRRRYWLP